MRFFEFVALIALLMAITALSIDIMLPALPDIARTFAVAEPNRRQLVVSVYFVGFASGQFIFGPVSDRYGRKRPLFVGLGIYVIGTLFALGAQSFDGLLAARVVQGVGAAAPRVIALAIVRDRFGGREMARVMSFVMMVFIVVPVLAPGLGEGIQQFASWRMIFAVLLAAAGAAAAWIALRLPETQHPEDRIPLSAAAVGRAVLLVATTRQTVGYIVAMGFVFALMVSYIVSAEQVFVGVYELGASFPLYFGGIACFMVAASAVNAFAVRTAGMRSISHRALLSVLAICAALAVQGFPERPPLPVFCLFMAGIFFCFGLIMPNFNALAMEPMSHIAGTASSIAGFYSTTAAAIIGTTIGQSFDGTVRPLFMGITLLFTASLITVLITERGQLAKPSPPAVPKRPSGRR